MASSRGVTIGEQIQGELLDARVLKIRKDRGFALHLPGSRPILANASHPMALLEASITSRGGIKRAEARFQTPMQGPEVPGAPSAVSNWWKSPDSWLLPEITTHLGFLLALVFLAYLIRQKRSPASTMAWLLLVLFLPWVGVPLYLMLGGRKMSRMARRKAACL